MTERPYPPRAGWVEFVVRLPYWSAGDDLWVIHACTPRWFHDSVIIAGNDMAKTMEWATDIAEQNRAAVA